MPPHPHVVEFRAFEGLDIVSILNVHAPPLRSAEDAFYQLEYLRSFAGQAGAKSVAIEHHYIDRDYIEDHSVFYSKSLHQYGNACQRIHFFDIAFDELQLSLRRIADGARTAPADYYDSCDVFSRQHYLGFSVIKPLHGSPVGRSVLRSPSAIRCARSYEAHLLGVRLKVVGVPFQQQDVGVSACATTALWCSLRVMGGHERFSPASPSQITKLAAQSYLPFGRAMPQSEGLNAGQLCQAVEALGLAPVLLRPRSADDALGLLHSAVVSRLAPVLLVTQHQANSAEADSHAIAATGFDVDAAATARTISDTSVGDPALRINALYLHDDRIGPYLRAPIEIRAGVPQLLAHLPIGKQGPTSWRIDQILIAVHPKVRLSFAGLRSVGIDLASLASEELAKRTNYRPGDGRDPPVELDVRIWRSHAYLEELLRHSTAPLASVMELSATLPLPRYLGVVRLSAPFLPAIDVLIDTTSTNWNLHCVAVIQLSPIGGIGTAIATALAEHLTRPDEEVRLIAHP